MRQALLTLSLIFGFSVSCLAVDVISVVGPVTVKLASNTVSISDGLWTPYSPNVAYMLGKVGIGTSAPTNTLSIFGTVNLSSNSNGIEIGTLDAFGRYQIWNKASGSIVRLGASTADGDSLDNDSNGIAIYKPSTDRLARIKPDAMALRVLSTGVDFWHVGFDSVTYNLGSGDIFRVVASSVHLGVPLVFQDGTTQSSAGGVAVTSCAVFYSGSNIYSKSNSMTGSVSGTDNLGLGDYTLNAANVSGSYNIGIGYTALRRITSGPGNIAVGIFAGTNLTSGQNNIVLGQSVMENSTDPGYTFAAGYEALKLFSGSGAGDSGQFNTAISYQPLYNMSSGDDNIAIGYRAGFGTGNMTGITGNLLLGHEAGYSITTNSKRNVMLGYRAGYNETGSDKLYISSGPSTAPLIKGDFAAQTLTVNGILTVGISTGTFTILGSTISNTNCGVVGSYCGQLKMNDGSIHYFPIY